MLFAGLTVFLSDAFSVNLQVVAGKLVEQGPVVIISFQSQQIVVARNAKGEVVEGDPVSIVFGILGYYEHLSPETTLYRLVSGSRSFAFGVVCVNIPPSFLTI